MMNVPDLIDSVYLLLSVTDADKKARAESLFVKSRAVYDATLTDCIAEVGCSGRGRLLGGPELTALKERAMWAADTIGDTYNKALPKALEAAQAQWLADHGSREGMQRLWLAKQGRDAMMARAQWKEPQIAITEAAFTTDRARLDFWRRNSIEGMVRVRPAKAVCKICKRYVRKQWVTMQEAQRLFHLPVHINCPHQLQIRPDKATVPPCDQLWRGQVMTGRKQIGEVITKWAEIGRKETARLVNGLAEVARALEGGPGSGHFGHAGRPGEVGGSDEG